MELPNPASARESGALRRLVASAAFWWERIEGDYRPVATADAQTGRRALERWCAVVDGTPESHRGDRSQSAAVEPDATDLAPLARRLSWDGLDPEKIAPWLGPVELRAETPLPSWAAVLEQVFDAAAAEGDRNASTGLLDPEHPLPFEHLLLPAVSVASRRLRDQLVKGRDALLTKGAWRALERNLLSYLCELSAHAFYAELARERPAGLAFLDLALPNRSGSGETAHYKAFVARELASGLTRLAEEYPVLFRLIATAIEQWVASSAELIERLEADGDALGAVFDDGRAVGAVIDIEAGLSDRHRGGRTTAILRFASGLRAVYKPKDLAPDRLFQKLLDWCNAQPGLLSLRTTRILERQGYGWVEHIDRPPCSDREAAHRYYRRAGQLLALVYAVRGTDCHMENLLASGEHPVLVDHETLFFPLPRLLSGEQQARAAERLGSSILTTGFLPQWELNQDQVAFDTSGFGEGAGDTEWTEPCWLAINTDDMRRGRCRVEGYDAHRPWLADADGSSDGRQMLSVLDYTAELIEGFDAAFQALQGAGTELLSPGGPLAELGAVTVRFLFRRTAVYMRIHLQLRKPEYLRDGATYSIELDLLSQAFLAERERSHAWGILDAERRGLAECDVPMFFHRAEDHALHWTVSTTDGDSRTTTLPSYFERGSLERVRDGLAQLDDEDRRWQTRVLEISFFTRRARKPSDESLPAERGATPQPLSDEAALDEVDRLAEAIRATAIHENDGSVSWIGLAFAPRVELYQLENLDPQLYHGLTGIALFLAALYRVRGREDDRDLSLRAVQRTLREIADPELRERVADKLGLGGIAGIGSVVYGLVRSGVLLGDRALLDAAASFAGVVTPRRIAEDKRLDLLNGSAGTLLALLALRSALGARAPAELLERAMQCGEHLIAARRATEAGWAWPTLFARPLTGFSHGAAGIAYALLELWGASGDDRFLRAAEEGIRYEQNLFSETARNWPDLRAGDDGRARFMTSWCHGAPGIGLARLLSLPLLDTPAIRRDLEVALETTQRFGVGSIDSLCCGTCGRIDILNVAAARLERPELIEAARRMAGGVVARGRRYGGYRAFDNLPPSATPPGLFMGLAGIGYTLLRLVEPDLPSVLAMA